MAIISFDEYMAQQKKNVIANNDIAPVKTSSTTTNRSVAQDRINALKPEIRAMLEDFENDQIKNGLFNAEQKILDATGWDIETLNSYYADMKTAKGEGVWFQKGATRDGNTKENKKKARQATAVDIGANATIAAGEMTENVIDDVVANADLTATAKLMDMLAKRIKYIFKPEEEAKDAEKQAQRDAEIAEFVSKDLIKSEQFANEKIIAPFEEKTGLNVEEDSYFGEKVDGLVQSAANMGVRQLVAYGAGTVSNIFYPGSGKIVTPVVGNLLTFMSSGGEEIESALNNKDNPATLEQARMSGLISGTGEVISEAMFGGYKFGGKTITDYASKGIEKYLGDKLLGSLAKLGFNTVGEGVEELVSGWISALGKRFTYMNDKEIKEIFTKEEAWDSFISGMALGGFLEGTKVVNSTVNPNTRNYVTERSKNEQKVFDNLYEEAVKNAETEKGEKLTDKEKSVLYNEIEKALEGGEVDIDTIQKVLDRNTYTTKNKLQNYVNDNNVPSNSRGVQPHGRATENSNNSLSNNDENIGPIVNQNVKGNNNVSMEHPIRAHIPKAFNVSTLLDMKAQSKNDIGPVREDIGMLISKLRGIYSSIVKTNLGTSPKTRQLTRESLVKQVESAKIGSAENDESSKRRGVKSDDTNSVLGEGGLDLVKVNIDEIRPQLKTEPDTAFFWSGKTDGVGGAEVAADIAKGKGGVTLESTIEAKDITMPEWDFNDPSSMDVWDMASAAYAEQVSGEVRAVVGIELRPDNIWENVELPRLMENPNVTKITIIDPKTGIETVIFER